MHEDVERHLAQAEEVVMLWDQHKINLVTSAKGDDVQSLVNAGTNCYSFHFAAKYSKWNFDRYLRDPQKYEIDNSLDTKTRKLLIDLKSVEEETRAAWYLVENKLKRSLPRAEWKKYNSAVEAQYGPPRYAVDLGLI